MIDEPLQTSAIDEGQLAYATRKVKDAQRTQIARWREQLSTYDGREFVWSEIFGELKLFDYIASTDLQALGVRNTALALWGHVQRHPELFLQMQNEAIARAKKEREERRASRTPRST